MTRASRLILMIGFVISLICGAGIIDMAWDHNPQDVYTDDPWALVWIGGMGAVIVMLPFSVLAVLFSFFRQHRCKLTAPFYCILTGLVCGVSVACLLILSQRNGFALNEYIAFIYGLTSIISFPFIMVAFVITCCTYFNPREATKDAVLRDIK